MYGSAADIQQADQLARRLLAKAATSPNFSAIAFSLSLSILFERREKNIKLELKVGSIELILKQIWTGSFLF